MKRTAGSILLSLVLACPLAACAAATAAPAATPFPAPPGWKLDWHDEFDDTAIKGDREDLTPPDANVALLERVRPRCKRLFVVLLSGRPLIVTEHLPQWDAYVAAWLPGTAGQSIADVLFGDYHVTGKLPWTWPWSMDQIPLDFEALEIGDDAPLFPFG